ncbi:MAG: hypothetical protein DMG98_20020, partial [Acidobacteria bacterium]
PVRTDRFSVVLFALQTYQLQLHTLICSLLFSKSSALAMRLHNMHRFVVCWFSLKWRAGVRP